MKAVWWIKKDFRILDNQCISKAVEECSEILPFFCWEPSLINEDDYSSFHLQANWHALSGLCLSLIKRKSYPRIVFGDVIHELNKLYGIYSFDRLYSHVETGNLNSFNRDKKVGEWCRRKGVQWIEINQNSVFRGANAEKRRKLLTKRDYRREGLISDPNEISSPVRKGLRSNNFEWNDLCKKTVKFSGVKLSPSLQKVDEKSAHSTLNDFLENRGLGYSGGISSPNTAFDHGSRLSVHLTWGTLSLRTIFSELSKKRNFIKGNDEISKKWKKSLRAFESRLHWRDHFIQRLESFPNMENFTLNPAYQNLKYENNSEFLELWSAGQTGFPMIDASMRCLKNTGFLNFRMRAMVVSFACFGLHLSWRFIHEPLAGVFTDYEPGIHLSQLQMQAGVNGFNTIRVYSPKKQFLDHDPDAKFVKKWIPELEKYTSVEIANAPDVVLSGYASPCIDLNSRSRKMKDRIFEIRKGNEGIRQTNKTLSKHGSKWNQSRKRKKQQDPQMKLTF